MKKEQAIHICLEGIYATAEIDQMGVWDLLPNGIQFVSKNLVILLLFVLYSCMI